MNPRLRILERQLGIQRQAEEKLTPAAEGLAAAIQAEIAKAVQAEIAQQVPPASQRARALLRSISNPSPMEPRLVAPAPASFPPPEMTLHRDELGRVNAMDIGRWQFRVIRGVDGRIVRMIPKDDAPLATVAPPAPLNRA